MIDEIAVIEQWLLDKKTTFWAGFTLTSPDTLRLAATWWLTQQAQYDQHYELSVYGNNEGINFDVV